MMRRLLSAEMLQTERQLRLIAILDASERIGNAPLEMQSLHALAYLTDALAPVWHLPVLDGQVLKRRNFPFFPALQRDLDLLVGRGVAKIHDFTHQEDEDGWRLVGSYALNHPLSDPILNELCRHELPYRNHAFVREVVYATSGLGIEEIQQIGDVDAAYSSQLVDFGGLVEIDEERGRLNRTASVALRFQQLTRVDATLSDAEAVHLYVRHLYSRMNVA